MKQIDIVIGLAADKILLLIRLESSNSNRDDLFLVSQAKIVALTINTSNRADYLKCAHLLKELKERIYRAIRLRRTCLRSVVMARALAINSLRRSKKSTLKSVVAKTRVKMTYLSLITVHMTITCKKSQSITMTM